MSKKTADTSLAHFEENLATLEQIVQAMEHGNLTLEQALKQFETGVQLIRQCQTTLQSAEQKIQILQVESGKQSLALFTPVATELEQSTEP